MAAAALKAPSVSQGKWGHIIAFAERQVLRNLREYVTIAIAHSTLDGEPQEGLRGPPVPGRRLRSIPVCGGLIHRYEWKERAA